MDYAIPIFKRVNAIDVSVQALKITGGAVGTCLRCLYLHCNDDYGVNADNGIVGDCNDDYVCEGFCARSCGLCHWQFVQKPRVIFRNAGCHVTSKSTIVTVQLFSCHYFFTLFCDCQSYCWIIVSVCVLLDNICSILKEMDLQIAVSIVICFVFFSNCQINKLIY